MVPPYGTTESQAKLWGTDVELLLQAVFSLQTFAADGHSTDPMVCADAHL